MDQWVQRHLCWGRSQNQLCQCSQCELQTPSKETPANGLRTDTTPAKKCHGLLPHIYETMCMIANECNLLKHILWGCNCKISLTCLCAWYDDF